jgi:phenylalanine-4-hydroxylase
VPVAWRRYVTEQRHTDYTAAEHETWRRLVAQTEALLGAHESRLHPDYVAGFRQLVLPWKAIPELGQISEVLEGFGWSTVSVDGYIPAEVYSGLIGSGIFPVSRNIRRPEQLDFSPTPDLAHDLIGHIPMLVSAEHRQFLRRLSRAIASAPAQPVDRELYRANREMAALRCRTTQPPRAAAAAEARVQAAQQALAAAPTRLARLERLYLWTIEFGLLGSVDDFHIYGAGLLSSPAETRHLCTSGARVFDFSTDVSERQIDFSQYQSAYFVAGDYEQLNAALTAVCRLWVEDERWPGDDLAHAH